MVKISIIIPVYNVEKYLDECLVSVINQTFQDMEIICVNDGSTDNSLKILENYAKIDSRVNIISQKNQGLSSARNTGMKIATGDYIYFCDSDDYLDLNAMRELYEIAEENSADLVLFKLKNFDDVTRKKMTTRYFEMNHLNHLIGKVFDYHEIGDIFNFNVTVYSKFFKRDLILDAKFPYGLIFEDNCFTMEYIFNAKRIYYYGKYLYYRRIRENSIISVGSKKHADIIYIYEKIFNKLKELNLHEEYNHDLFNFQVIDIFNRYTNVQLQYKEYFFKEIKNNFIQFVEECKTSLDFNLINPKCKFVFFSAVSSNNHVEFNLKNELYDILLEIHNSTNDESFFHEKNIIKKCINDIFFEDLDDKKSVLSYYIKKYKQMYSILINTSFENLLLTKLINWSKLLIFYDLSIHDKIDLLRFSKPLFDKFFINKIRCDSDLLDLIKLIYNENYVDAFKLINLLSIKYHKDEFLVEELKNKNIFIIFKELTTELHGFLKIVFDKSNLFDDEGYSVCLLNMDPLKNFKTIINKYYELGYLNKSINVLNIYEYYANKNTLRFENTDELNNENLFNSIKKINSDNSVTLKYFDDNGVITNEELYISGYLALKKIFKNNTLEKEYYYTCDGFNYFYRDYKDNDILLFDRFNDNYLSFNNIRQFEDYFLSELSLKSYQKPFLINEYFNRGICIKNIDSDIAYKINMDYLNSCKCSCNKCDNQCSHPLKGFETEDVVVFTNSIKKELVKEFRSRFIVIPKFINYNPINKQNHDYKKEHNVISIFGRLTPEKNLGDLITAFDKVLQIHEDAILKIFGYAVLPNEISEKEKLENLIDKLDLSKSVKLMGHVNNVYEEMSNSIATVFCSNDHSSSIVILESMINSTSVISYGDNCFSKNLINNKNGFLVERHNVNQLAETILYILDNPDKVIKMGNLARKYVINNFNEKIFLNKWENLLKEIYLIDSMNINEVY